MQPRGSRLLCQPFRGPGMHDTGGAILFGQWLSRQRKAKDLTQEDLAERLGCSVWSIQKIEAGNRRPSRQVAEILAGYFDIQPAERDSFLRFARGLAAGWEVPPTLSEAAPAPSAPPSNLPTQLTSFVGRDIELPRIRDLMLTAEVRLLTLTGPPGTGKTRLALQVAGELLPEFEHGIIFVDLAPISDPALVMSEIAQSLGVGGSGVRSLSEAVEGYLKDRRLLLILDNFEQVVAAAPEVAALLMNAPGLKVMATSRVPLHVRGEKEFAVPPLQLPNPDHLPPADRLSRYEAVRLFVERAADVDTDFAVTDSNAESIARICARLDGLPLAIELAAARVKILSPQAILSRLESRFELLTGGPRDLPARQRTLRSAIEWSYDLLDGEEEKLFRRLSVFQGGRTLQAIHAVCSAPGDLGLDPLDGVQSLVNKSLLRRQESLDGEVRFVMLETIHEYARERLQQSGEEASIKRLHALYFTALSEEAGLAVWGPTDPRWLDRLEEEHDNLRAALSWSCSVEGDPELALRLVVALGRFWEIRGHLSEGRERIASALSGPESRAEELRSLRAWALVQTHSLSYWQGDFSASRSAAEEALRVFRELGETQGIARALGDLWDTTTAEGDHRVALALATEGLQITREIQDQLGTVIMLVLQGWSLMYLGNFTGATAPLEEALVSARKLGVANRVALTLSALGEVKMRQGRYNQALPLLEEALAIRRNTGHKVYIATILGTMALAAIRQKAYGQATEMLAESLSTRLEIGDKGGIAWCLEKFAQIMSAEGDQHDLKRATRLLGAAAELREALGTAVDTVDIAEYDEVMSIARDRLDADEFASAWQDGRALSMNVAAALALNRAQRHA
jgi:predicted ATPase/DNA-binding XRE family transcriptional regulator